MNPRNGCARVRSRLERLVDRALDPVQEALDRGHLEACEPCRAARERWIELTGLVQEASRVSARDLDVAVQGALRRIAEEPMSSRFHVLRGRGFLSILTAAGAILLLFAASRFLDGALRIPDESFRPQLHFEFPHGIEVLGSLFGGLGR